MNVLDRLRKKTYKSMMRLLLWHNVRRFFPFSVLNKLTLRLKKDFAVVDGKCMYLGTDDLDLSINGVYEPAVVNVMMEYVKEGGTVLDIGAHIGYHTLILAKLVGEKGLVYAFEPDRENFALLINNVTIRQEATHSKTLSVIVKNVAVSDIYGEDRLFISKNNKADHRLFDSGDNRDSVVVKTVSLDSYFPEDFKVDFIKMDIEGSEYKALQGMKKLLARNNVVLITELWPYGLEKAGVSAEQYLKELEELGFVFYNIFGEGVVSLPLTKNMLLDMVSVEKRNYINILCIKKNGGVVK